MPKRPPFGSTFVIVMKCYIWLNFKNLYAFCNRKFISVYMVLLYINVQNMNEVVWNKKKHPVFLKYKLINSVVKFDNKTICIRKWICLNVNVTLWKFLICSTVYYWLSTIKQPTWIYQRFLTFPVLKKLDEFAFL